MNFVLFPPVKGNISEGFNPEDKALRGRCCCSRRYSGQICS